MCELQIMATKGPPETPAWMQLSEVALYGPGMAPLTISSASADCENTDASEGADQAVDGDTSTKWLCSPFVYGAGESVCENTCPGVPSWASDGYCDGAPTWPRIPEPQTARSLLRSEAALLTRSGLMSMLECWDRWRRGRRVLGL